MPSIFDLYKPLRNQIRNSELIESLKLCWHFANYLDKEIELPSYIEFDAQLKHNFNPMLFRVNVIGDWELEFLVSEILLNSSLRIFVKKQSLRNLKSRNSCISHIRRIRDASYTNLSDVNDIFLEMNRMSHQQFIWQSNYTYTSIYRYYKIFNSNTLSAIILEKFNLSLFEIIKTGLVLFTFFSMNFNLPSPVAGSLANVNAEIINKFLSNHCASIDSLKNYISNAREYGDTLLYAFNPIRKYPLFEIGSSIYCPIPKLLYWQITSGLYYSICSLPSFDNAFGLSFQNYLTELIKKVSSNQRLTLHSERSYGKPEKKTADIIIEDNDSLLFIECKTKRMVWRAKEQFNDTLDLEIDIQIISKAFYQLYNTVQDYQFNLYPHIQFNPNKNVFVMVITLEDWYLGYNNFLYAKLRENIISSFITDNKIAKITLDIPYFFFSSEEFEKAIQVIVSVGIGEFCTSFLNKSGFDAFKSFEYKKIFEDEVRSLFFNNPQ